ncbi:uncharacterized protein KQ657_002210 [Scheffersomyces spartinae]|uniref:Auxin efflux carrier n=1 Tax=Scheffersomyces spartinae TaxID=45513 RepID=A0A9P8AJV4_9ASCO|nr:uncharacterized protein KQ657_002210 [Scheffersomyces spartinae]KAG7195825.1 hypothetical protein KQ657_002210 [Scheffersomyces spartinae]
MSISTGSVIYTSVRPIFKIYFIITIGIFLAKKNILSVPTCRDISDLVVTALMPCLIFNQVVTNLKSSDIQNLGVIFFLATLLFSFGFLLAFVTYYVTKSPKRWFGGLLSVGLFPNISDLPIAYLQTLSKGTLFTTLEVNRGVAFVCLFLAAQVLYQFTFGLYQLVEWDFKEELAASRGGDVESKENDGTSARKQSGESHLTSTDVSQTISSSIIEQDDEQNDDGRLRDDGSRPLAAVDREKASRRSTSKLSSTSRKREQQQHEDFLRAHEVQRITSNAISSINSDFDDEYSQPKSVTSSHGRGSFSSRNSVNKASLNSSVPQNLLRVASRATDIRKMPSQTVDDVINEYSEIEGLRQHTVRRVATVTTEVAAAPIEPSTLGSNLPGHISQDNESSLSATTSPSIVQSFSKKLRSKWKARALVMLKNFLGPNSVALIISIAVAFSPPLKALFVPSTQVHIHPAPDNQPPLSFIMDVASYVGAASVPMGLLLLGATISRLQIKKMPSGFWKTAVVITCCRLVILPIIGVGLTTGFQHGGWYGDDPMIRFVSVLEFGLPNATALVYFTAFYTDPKSEDHLQMDCLAICLLCQYSVLFITLPILVLFTIKVSLGL